MTEATEAFWRGEFGIEYTKRNTIEWESRAEFFADLLNFTGAKSVLEVGCNKGHNLEAINHLRPDVFTHGIDINQEALEIAKANGLSVSDMPASEVGMCFQAFDMVFSAGLLIHIPPSEIHDVISGMISASSKWVVAIEYAAIEEVEVDYRGHADRLWKRPYGDIFRQHGLFVSSIGDAGPGFDRCTCWVGQKPDWDPAIDDAEPTGA